MIEQLADIGIADSTVAGIVTSIATVLTALGGLVLAIGVLIPILRTSRQTQAQVAAVHVIVNQQRTDAQRYQIALVELLKSHSIDVPVEQSLPVSGQGDAQPGQPKTL